MNVRFSDDAIRLRVSRPAFDGLLAGDALRLPMHGTAAAILVDAGPRFDARTSPGLLHVTWPGDALRALAERLPARDGLEFRALLEGREIRISLEVDVRPGRLARTGPPAAR